MKLDRNDTHPAAACRKMKGKLLVSYFLPWHGFSFVVLRNTRNSR